MPIVDEVVGLLVERDEEVFAEAVIRLLEDPVRRESLGRKGREEIMRHWTWDHAVRRLETILLETANHRRVEDPLQPESAHG